MFKYTVQWHQVHSQHCMASSHLFAELHHLNLPFLKKSIYVQTVNYCYLFLNFIKRSRLSCATSVFMKHLSLQLIPVVAQGSVLPQLPLPDATAWQTRMRFPHLEASGLLGTGALAITGGAALSILAPAPVRTRWRASPVSTRKQDCRVVDNTKSLPELFSIVALPIHMCPRPCGICLMASFLPLEWVEFPLHLHRCHHHRPGCHLLCFSRSKNSLERAAGL